MTRFKKLLYKYFCLFYCCLHIFLNEPYHFYITEDIEEEITEEITEGAENGETMPQPSTETEEEEGSEKLQMETDSEGIVVMNPKPKRRGKAVNKLVKADKIQCLVSQAPLRQVIYSPLQIFDMI